MRTTLWTVIAACVALTACGDSKTGGGSDVAGGDTIVGTDTNVPFDTSNGQNHAPEFERIGDRVVAVGETLVIVVSAKDADDDPLSYSLYGSLPEGARFDKAEHRFEWTPSALGATVFLTFVVSDGHDFDRETVRIEVTNTSEAHAPVFTPVGDQQLVVDRDFGLELEATDPDGDTLTFGHERQLPAGATLDAATGLFLWRPTAADAGTTQRITFTVSDGELSATMLVKLTVTDGQTSSPQPPVVDQLPPQAAVVGQPLSFTLTATDPNGDAVSFSILSGAPAGGVLTDATFRWTPPAGEAGRTYNVVFAAEDGSFTTLSTVQINVAATAGVCTPDSDEPNESVELAHVITPGLYQRSICDTEASPDLADVYAVAVPANKRIVATLTFDATLADLDLYLDSADANLAASELLTSPERLGYNEVAGGTLYLWVVPFGGDDFKVPYSLSVAFEEPTAGCVDDGFEDNDTPATAKGVPPENAALQICGGDLDWWSVPVTCGQHIEIGMDITGDADLDIRLFANADGTGTPLASSLYDDPFEIIDVPRAPASGTYALVVSGYPPEEAEGAYHLLVDTSGGCQEDANQNATVSTAKALSGTSGSSPGLTVCCSRDWFSIELPQGSDATFDVTRTDGTGTLELTLYGADGTTVLATNGPSAANVSATLTAQGAGRRYVRVGGEIGTQYALAWSVTSGGGCTYMSCAEDDICDTASGTCIYNDCLADGDCPGGLACRDSFCLNPCTGDSDCRTGFRCKTFDVGKRCGLEGTVPSGGDCDWFPDCQASLVCSSEGKCIQR